jgi:hypothetical protein
VPKRDPGTTKDTPPTSYRVTMDALIKNCLKPVASKLPLATHEINKLHGFKYFLKLDDMHEFWAIPLDEVSKTIDGFQTHECVFAWSRLTAADGLNYGRLQAVPPTLFPVPPTLFSLDGVFPYFNLDSKTWFSLFLHGKCCVNP